MTNMATWPSGNIVRLGPMNRYKASEVVAWLHEQHGGSNYWRDYSSHGLTGYKGGAFRVKSLRVENAKYMLDVALPDNSSAMLCYLNWI